jgi:hypothetical protein
MRYTSPAVPNHQIYKLRVGLPVSAPTCIAQREVEQCCIAAGNGCRTKQASKEQQRQVAPAGGWQERQGTNKATPCSVLSKTMFQRAACRQHSAMGTHRQQKQHGPHLWPNSGLMLLTVPRLTLVQKEMELLITHSSSTGTQPPVSFTCGE